MELNTSFNINQICRVCLVPTEIPKVTSLFFSRENSIQLWTKIMACAWVQIFEGDGMPSLICHKCQDRLDDAYSFKQQCEASDTQLRQFLGLPAPIIDGQNLIRKPEYNTQSEQNISCDNNNYRIDSSLKSDVSNDCTGMKKEPLFTSQISTYSEPDNEIDQSFKCEATNVASMSNVNRALIVTNIATDNAIPNEYTKQTSITCGTQYEEINNFKSEFLDEIGDSESILNSDTPLNELCETMNETKKLKGHYIKGKKNKRSKDKLNKHRVKTKSKKLKRDEYKSKSIDDDIKLDPEVEISQLEDESTELLEFEEEDCFNRIDENSKKEKKQVQEQCELCGKIFHYRGYMAQHMRTHTGDKPFKCEFCPQRFSMYHSLVIHSRIHSGDRPFICAVCGKGFTQSAGLTSHMRSHTGEKPFQCEICSKQFSQSSNLLIHRQIHTGQRDHVCPTCNMAFKFLKHLQSHMKLHTGVKDYTCSICQKKFHRKSYLTTHMAIHSGHRPYKCSDCGHAFSNSSNLTAHMRIHTGIKPYVCQVCKKAFAQSSALTRHVQQHSDVSKAEARGIPQYPLSGEPKVHKGVVDLNSWRLSVAKTQTSDNKDVKDFAYNEGVKEETIVNFIDEKVKDSYPELKLDYVKHELLRKDVVRSLADFDINDLKNGRNILYNNELIKLDSRIIGVNYNNTLMTKNV